MAKKLSSALGVDLGSRYIKIAEVKLQGRQPVVTALGVAATPEGAVDHLGVNDPKAISAVLKQLIAASGASVGDVVLSLAGQQSVMVRPLEVPTMSDSELKSHMDWEITRNIPFSESSVVSDYKAFPPSQAGAQNMDVVMAIAPQSVVDLLIDLVKSSGKKVAAFDVEPLGLARSLKFSYDTTLQGKTVCVTEIGHKTTAINIYQDGKLVMCRQVPIGGEMVTRALADGLGMSFDDAETLKTTRASVPASAGAVGSTGGYGADAGATGAFPSYNPFADATAAYNPFAEAAPAQPEAGYSPFASEEAAAPEVAPAPAMVSTPTEDPETLRIYNAMAPIIEEIGSEVRRSVDYFRGKGSDVDYLLLCGGAAKLKGLDHYLAGILGVEVGMMDPLQGLTLNAKKADPSMVESSKPDFAVAVGNGLHIAF